MRKLTENKNTNINILGKFSLDYDAHGTKYENIIFIKIIHRNELRNIYKFIIKLINLL